MDRHATLLLAVMAVQLYSATDEVWSMLADMDDATSHLQTMSTNAVGVLSTVLTAMCSVRLRRVRGSLDRVERTLQPGPVDGHDWPTERRARAWLVAAVAAFGYLKYAQLIESDDDKRSFTAAGKALLRTMSAAGNYYVSVMFIDHVLLAKRFVCGWCDAIIFEAHDSRRNGNRGGAWASFRGTRTEKIGNPPHPTNYVSRSILT